MDVAAATSVAARGTRARSSERLGRTPRRSMVWIMASPLYLPYTVCSAEAARDEKRLELAVEIGAHRDRVRHLEHPRAIALDQLQPHLGFTRMPDQRIAQGRDDIRRRPHLG